MREKRGGGGGGGRKQPRGKILDHRPLSLQQHTTTSEYNMIKKCISLSTIDSDGAHAGRT